MYKRDTTDFGVGGSRNFSGILRWDEDVCLAPGGFWGMASYSGIQDTVAFQFLG
jgi:hypothetical protein